MRTSFSAGRRAAAAALCSAALAAAATGCGSTTSTASGTSRSTASGSLSSKASGVSSTASPSAAAGPLAGLTADQIGGKALADLKAAQSFRVAGSMSDSGKTYALDLTYGVQDCKGTVAVTGEGSIRLLKKGKKVWVKPDGRFWKHIGAGFPSYVLSIVEGKYLEPAKGRDLSALGGFCDRHGFISSFDGDLTGMTKGKVTRLSGRPVLQLLDGASTVYVTISAHPYIVRIADQGEHGRVDFTGYDEPVSVTAPHAGQTLDGARYGF